MICFSGPNLASPKPGVGTYRQVFDSEDDRVGQVDLGAVFADGRREDGRVDDDRVVGGQSLVAKLHAGVLRGQVGAQFFVQDEGHPDFT